MDLLKETSANFIKSGGVFKSKTCKASLCRIYVNKVISIHGVNEEKSTDFVSVKYINTFAHFNFQNVKSFLFLEKSRFICRL